MKNLTTGRAFGDDSRSTLVRIGILVAIDINSVIALASRAFALFYALQCLVAFESVRKKSGGAGKAAAFMALALISFSVFVFGVPAG